MHVALLLPLLVQLVAAFVVPAASDATALAPPSLDLLSSPSTSTLARKGELYNNRVLLIRHGGFIARTSLASADLSSYRRETTSWQGRAVEGGQEARSVSSASARSTQHPCEFALLLSYRAEFYFPFMY